MYRVVRIRFWSLRNTLGPGYGVIFDVDTRVARKARRVRCDLGNGQGWKWQIPNLKKITEWDCFAETDQEVLDEMGSDLYEVDMYVPYCDLDQ